MNKKILIKNLKFKKLKKIKMHLILNKESLNQPLSYYNHKRLVDLKNVLNIIIKINIKNNHHQLRSLNVK